MSKIMDWIMSQDEQEQARILRDYPDPVNPEQEKNTLPERTE